MHLLHYIFFLGDFHDNNFLIFNRENPSFLENERLIQIIDFWVSPAILQPIDVLSFPDNNQQEKICNNNSTTTSVDSSVNVYGTYEQKMHMLNFKIKSFEKGSEINKDEFENHQIESICKLLPRESRLIYLTLESLDRLYKPILLKREILGDFANIMEITAGNSLIANITIKIYGKIDDNLPIFDSNCNCTNFLKRHASLSILWLYSAIIHHEEFNPSILSWKSADHKYYIEKKKTIHDFSF